MAEQRPMRMCDSCGIVDDHPRHVFALADGDGVTDSQVAAQALRNAAEEDFEAIVAQIQDSSTIMRHMDCCRERGCPDGSCNTVTAGAENLRGYDLVEHLTSRPAERDTREGGVVEGSRNEDQPFAESTLGAATVNDPANESE